MKGFFKEILFGLLLFVGAFLIGGVNNITLGENDSKDMGIHIDTGCLVNGQCSFNIYETLGTKKTVVNASSPEIFVQDILLSATFFIGTVVTLALVISGVMFIMASATGKSPDKAKAGIKNSLIGLLIVVSSYSIIRIVQYIARGV